MLTDVALDSTPVLGSSKVVDELSQLLQLALPKIFDYIDNPTQLNNINLIFSPQQLLEKVDFKIKETPQTLAQLSTTLDELFAYSINTFSPKFADKLYTASNPIGILSELLLATLNANSHVYHVSPLLTTVELLVGKKLASLFGLNEQFSGGLTFPGGSNANLTALTTVRNLRFPQVKKTGLRSLPELVIFASELGHYSIEKSVVTLGLGTDQLIKVRANLDGKMCTEALRLAIQASIRAGQVPLAVVATSGTTVMGAFDDLELIGKVCSEFNVWLHVDASWGGAVSFLDHSCQHRNLLRGSERSDSITFNPHKLLGVPLQCAFLLLKDRRTLKLANQCQADYLFHSPNSVAVQDPSYWNQDLDLGDGTLGCGRKPDAFKLFLTWKYNGHFRLQSQVLKAFDLTHYLTKRIEATPCFKLAFLPQSFNVGFWFVGYLDWDLSKEKYNSKWGKLTKAIHSQLRSNGTFLVDYAPLTFTDAQNKQVCLPPFFRMVTHHPHLTLIELDFLLEQIQTLGTNLVASI